MLLTILGKRPISGKIVELYCRDEKGRKIRFTILEMRNTNKELKKIKTLSRQQFNNLPDENLPLTDLINLFGAAILSRMEE